MTISRRSISALVVACVALVGRAPAAEYPRWGKLPPGKYPVGFRSDWEFDFSRTYDTTFADGSKYADGKTPRPILVNVWYPAAGGGGAMPHRGYLDLPANDPRVRKLAAALAAYNRDVIAQEVAGKPPAELTAAETKLLEQYLDTPTAGRRDAPVAAGKFPLVIYHAGYGSSLEDNAVLCEFLASHGYVVVGSAFQEPTGKSFNVDGKTTSARDFEFLIAHAARMPNVDWGHVGVIGHSGGAHAALMFRGQESSAVDAVVCLDTTQDYYSLSDLRWSNFVPKVLDSRRLYTGPLLAVANPYAFFPLFDRLDGSRRYYLTLRDLEHNDFISQGSAAQELRVKLLAGRNEDTKDAEARLDAIRNAYEALNWYVLRFLEAYLKGDPTAREGLLNPHPGAKLGGAEPYVEHVPAGASAPPPYRGDGLPTPRQLRPYLEEHGVEKTVALLKRVRQEDPNNPLLHRLFFYALVYELFDKKKDRDVLAVAAFAREVHPRFDGLFVASGETYGRFGRREYALKCFRIALALDPKNETAARLLRDLEKPAKK